MEIIKKQNISNSLKSYVERYDSQNRAAQSLKNVSAATVNQILNGKWDLISDEMWRNVASQIGYKDEKWNAVQTADYNLLTSILCDVKENALVLAITGNAGSGKTFCCKNFTESNKNVYHIVCNDFWNSKNFMSELLSAIGRESSGMNIGEMMNEAVRTLKTQEKPLIILDEADKLKDKVLYLFISLYNLIEDECGIVLIATNHLEKRLRNGVKLNRKGFNEIWSRIGRKCVQLKGVTSADIVAVCEMNGVAERNDISDIIADSESDLRRVKRRIHATLKKKSNK
ncbi:MAG: ATP-binding protein [Prevotellaceae bacterium]|jgi:DNA transposition AAA+ family ATPase|nr:ATP-binding protein [Prevotellaceae bacterium]